MGATFGAGGSQTLFGARGAATLLSKLTTAAAIIFLLTSISLASIHRGSHSTDGGNSVVQPTDGELNDSSSTDENEMMPKEEATEEIPDED